MNYENRRGHVIESFDGIQWHLHSCKGDYPTPIAWQQMRASARKRNLRLSFVSYGDLNRLYTIQRRYTPFYDLWYERNET